MGRKRKASESVGDVEGPINPPGPGNFVRNVIALEEIVRASNILSVMSLSDGRSGNTVGVSAADLAIVSGLGLTYVTWFISNATSVTGIHRATLGVDQSRQADMLP